MNKSEPSIQENVSYKNKLPERSADKGKRCSRDYSYAPYLRSHKPEIAAAPDQPRSPTNRTNWNNQPSASIRPKDLLKKPNATNKKRGTSHPDTGQNCSRRSEKREIGRAACR